MQLFIMKKIMIVAHRGASAYEPENTILSFKTALKFKPFAIECDVRETKDKKLVIIHDSKVDRTTNGKGFVKEFTFKEIRKLDAGKGEKIPSLQEVLDFIKNKKQSVIVEIKEPDTEKKIVSLIKKNKLENKTIIVSFYSEAIKKVKKISNIKTGFIFSRICSLKNIFEIAIKVKADFLLPRYHLISKQLIEKAHEQGFRVITWTVDDKKLASKLISLGVDGVATNKPDLFC